MKMILLVCSLLVLLVLAAVTIVVESEVAYRLEPLGGPGQARALLLFHPSRDAHFSDDLSSAVADGLKEAGFSVDRATLGHATPAAPKEYGLVAVVSNTYWWTPDLPTLRYLARAQLQGASTIGVIGGAGATMRSQALLDEALRKAGARAVQVRSFWLWRPNDEQRMQEDNRQVALELARQFGLDAGTRALSPNGMPSTDAR